MRIREHQPGCRCASCQGKYQQPVDDISGYASGFELVPDPNQELSPELMRNPDFIQSIINQVLQQIQMGGGMEEQLDPVYQDIAHGFGPTMGINALQKDPNYLGDKVPFYDPCNDLHHDAGSDDDGDAEESGGGGGGSGPIVVNPGGGQLGGADTPVAFGDIEDQGFTTNIEKIREYIASQIKSLSEHSSKVEEGSCGYSQSATGESLKTPGGTKGVDAQSRTNRMKTGELEEIDPKAPQKHKVQTKTASVDKSLWRNTRET